MEKCFWALLLAFFMLSCDQRTEVHEKYEIISLLYNSLTRRIPIPPSLFRDVAQKDSLRIMRTFQELQDSLASVKQIVAVRPSTKPVNLDPGNFRDNQKELVIQLNSLKQIKPLDVGNFALVKMILY